MRQMFRRTLGLSLFSGLLGLVVSWSVVLPVGAGQAKEFGTSGTITCIAVVLFAGSMGFSYLRRKFAYLG